MLLAAIGVLFVAFAAMAQPDAKEIVRKADEHLRGQTNKAEMTMRLERPDWSREISMKSWAKGTQQALILITAPARDEGTTFLKRGNEVWNWVPAVEKVIKIPPSMMMQSWMGSDFTNDDLVKESSIVEDYQHTLLGDTTIADRDCWKIQMIPKEEAAVVWGKVLLWVDKQDDLQLRVEYFDEDEELINVMEMSDIKMMGGRLIPARMEMSPVDEPGNKTILTYQSLDFNIKIKDNFFSEQNMKRVR
ncbi:outer membrane lipoprotein-sorting protein [bacterium]|nr:outer membrane lipoprotein-sorting protein [bacterium]